MNRHSSLPLLILAIAWITPSAMADSFLSGFDPQPSLPQLSLYAEFDQTSVTPGSEVLLRVHATIPAGWHVYSVHSQGKDGPEPTSLSWSHPHYEKAGNLSESKPVRYQDKALGLELDVHKGAFTLKQLLKVSQQAPMGTLDLVGTISYQICDNHVCTPLQEASFTALMEVKNK